MGESVDDVDDIEEPVEGVVVETDELMIGDIALEKPDVFEDDGEIGGLDTINVELEGVPSAW